MKISLALILVLLAASPAAQQRSELPRPAGVPSNQEIRTKLESAQPAEQAWGAWWAAQLNVTELAPAIERVATANATRDYPAWLTASAAVDALIQLRVRVAASFARSLYGRYPTQALILLSRTDKDGDPVLVDLVASAEGIRWLAAANLAVTRRSPGLVPRLLRDIDITAHVFVQSSDSGSVGIGGGLGGQMVADGIAQNEPDFPPLALYYMDATPLPALPGMTVLAPGPTTVYYHRDLLVPGQQGGSYWHDQSGPSTTERFVLVDALLNGFVNPFQPQWMSASESKAVVWKDQATLERDIKAFKAEILSRYDYAVRRLVRERLLTDAEAAVLEKPAVIVRITDMRENPSTLPMTPIADAAKATLTIPGSADFLVGDTEGVWITNRGRMEKLQRDKPAPVVTVPMPRPCGAPALTYDAVWVANCSDQSFYRIDRKTNTVVATIPTGLADRSGELSVAASVGAIWLLTDAAGVLSRIDPQTNAVVAKIAVAPNSFAVAYEINTDSVWVTNTGARGATGPGSIQRIDPKTNRVVATIPVGPRPRFVTAGDWAVWTLNQGDGTVSRIDPKTNQVVATIDAGVPGDGGDIDASSGGVWVRGTRALLQQIDPSTNKVVAVFGPPAGSGAVRAVGDHVWVSAHDVQKVWVLGVR